MIPAVFLFAHGQIARGDLQAAEAARDAALRARETHRLAPRARILLQCPLCFARAAVESGSPARVAHARPGCDGTPFVTVLDE